MNTKLSQIIPILAFPLVLTLGIVLIPVVGDYSNHLLSEQAVGQTARWFSGHLLAAIGFVLSILAVNAIDQRLRSMSRALPGAAVVSVAVGAALYAAGLGADGIGPVAVQAAGYSPVIFFEGSGMWVTGIFIAGTIVFGGGILSVVISSIQQGLICGWSRIVCFASALLFMIAPSILSGWSLYGVALAVFGVFVPFALAMQEK